ncbi:MAG: GTP-binding protein [Chloroherpetonaceae bacterium]|nr:GTP-binding protein [Chloroherpetonaceae bacterium]MDW8437584.1 GTP-binding protein [Chloroherpetonaceae bacterium]
MNVVPINILTGFLGSGKTTLLRDLLRINAGRRKIAVMMNEIGEVSIDAKLLEGFSTPVFELNDGCICCSVNENFVAVLDELADKASPDLVVVETTGVANPMNILYSIIDPRFVIDAVIATVDAKNFLRMKDEVDVAQEQLDVADVVVITKDDLATPDELRAVQRYVAEHRPNANLFLRHSLDVWLLFGASYPRTMDAHLHEVHRHFEHEGIETFRFQSDEAFQLDLLQNALESLPKNLWRLKGVIHLASQPQAFILNFAYGRYAMEDYDGKIESRCDLVFIGKRILSQKADLIERLKSAFASQENFQTS